MKFLVKTLKWLVVLVLATASTAALTLLAWYRRWPLTAGLVLVVGLVALYFLVKGLRALWRWRNKQAFIARVMSSHVESAPQSAASAVDSVWAQGMERVHLSPSRFSKRLNQSQPWFLVLDQGNGGPSPLDSFGARLPKGDLALYWHFLSHSVALRLRSDNGQDWERLLELFAERRRSIPMRGLVFALQASELSGSSEAELAALGQRLRAQAQQFMEGLEASYPVYIMVQGLEELGAMKDLLDRLPAEVLEGALGALVAPGQRGAGRKAAEAAGDRLEELILDEAVQGRPPQGEDLKALRALRDLGAQLDLITENLSQELSHQTSIDLRGLFFCSSLPLGAGGLVPAFAAEFLSQVLPQSPGPQPLAGFPIKAGAKIALMAGWLLLWLCVCGLLAADTVYQYRVLNAVAMDLTSDEAYPLIALDQSSQEAADQYSRLYGQMNAIIRLERAQRSWFLPSLGVNMLGRSMAAAKLRYVQEVNRQVLLPMIEQFRSILSQPPTEENRGQDSDVVAQLSWLASALSDRLEQSRPVTLDLQRGQDSGSRAYPLTQLNEQTWTPVTGWLIVNALNWVDTQDQLTTLQLEVRSLLLQSLSRRGNALLPQILAQLNAANQGTVALSQFWRHVAVLSSSDVQIPYSFTAAGYRELQEGLEDFKHIVGDSPELEAYIQRFRDQYLQDYADAWEAFTEAFIQSAPSLRYDNLEASFVTSYGSVQRVSEVPHFQFLRRLAQESAPLVGALNREWIQSLNGVMAVTELALARHADPDTSVIRHAVAAAEASPEVMARLRDALGAVDRISDIRRAVGQMEEYLKDLDSLLVAASSPGSAYGLCAGLFGESKGLVQPEAQPFHSAQQNLEEALRLAGCGQSPIVGLLTGTLDFVAAQATIQAALTMQQRWEEEVLSNPSVFYGFSGGDAIFGPQGVVPLFVQNHLSAFLSRRSGAMVASTWRGTAFPFSDGFLSVLSQGERIAAQPLPPEPPESYRVEIRTRPVLVNPDAKLRPTMMTLTLQGQDGPQQLLNQNFPQDGVFVYSPARSGKVTLTISFPGFDLQTEYQDFKEFIQDFVGGEKTFFARDFMGSSRQMESAHIREVKVPIVTLGVGDIFIDAQGAQRVFPDLPSQIVRLVTAR